jgi:hypothetical protein
MGILGFVVVDPCYGTNTWFFEISMIILCRKTHFFGGKWIQKWDLLFFVPKAITSTA